MQTHAHTSNVMASTANPKTECAWHVLKAHKIWKSATQRCEQSTSCFFPISSYFFFRLPLCYRALSFFLWSYDFTNRAWKLNKSNATHHSQKKEKTHNQIQINAYSHHLFEVGVFIFKIMINSVYLSKSQIVIILCLLLSAWPLVKVI